MLGCDILTALYADTNARLQVETQEWSLQCVLEEEREHWKMRKIPLYLVS